MIQTRMDSLVGDYQSRLLQEATVQHLARTASWARKGTVQPDGRAAVRHPLLSLRSAWHAVRALRLHQPRLHPR